MASKIDPHVTDNVKHEVKQQFDAYGADLGDVMGLSERSNSSMSKSGKKKSSKVKGLLRKMSMKIAGVGSFLKSQSQDMTSDQGSEKGSSKSKPVMKKQASFAGGLGATLDKAMKEMVLTKKRQSMGSASVQKEQTISDEDKAEQI